jgi:gliding motility associated protien GldN
MKKVLFFTASLLFGLTQVLSAQAPDPVGGTTTEPGPRDRPYEVMTNQNRRMVPYPTMRQTDVMFERRVWREIDLREKMNQPYYYPLNPTNGRKNFITIVIDGLTTQADRYKAYDALSDDFMVMISSSDVASMGAYSDTQWIPDPEPPYTPRPQVISEPFKPENVKKIWLKEDWIFEKQMSVMVPRILGFCPLMQEFDRNTGEFRFNKPMYWVYFPTFREVLSVNEVYNTANHGQRLTYDDIFEKRLFSSKIWKVDNVFDRRIEDHVKGLEALLEGEGVKNELFLFEHDLWEQ